MIQLEQKSFKLPNYQGIFVEIVFFKNNLEQLIKVSSSQ